MGANVFRLSQTQPDALRIFMLVKGSPFDVDRPTSH